FEREYAITGFDGQRRFADKAVIVDIFRHTANAIAAHFRLAAVGVIHAHARVGLVGGTYKDESIGTDAEMAVADGPAEAGRIVRHGVREAIDIDVIVAAPLHFGETHV